MLDRNGIQGFICELFNDYMGDIFFVQAVPQPTSERSFVRPSDDSYGTVNLITSERVSNTDYIHYVNKDSDPAIPDLDYTVIGHRLLTLEIATYKQGSYNLIQTAFDLFSDPKILLQMRAGNIGFINAEEIREINIQLDGNMEERFIFNLILSAVATINSDIESIETQEITGRICLP